MAFLFRLLVEKLAAKITDKTRSTLLTQVLYILMVMLIWLVLIMPQFPLFFLLERILTSQKILLVCLGYILIIWPSGPAIGFLTQSFRRQLNAEEERGLQRAGLWIGNLERFFIYSFLITNNLSAIAIILGAKSIFRFGEIKDPTNRKETEYILIGSMLSFATAMAIGYLVKLLI